MNAISLYRVVYERLLDNDPKIEHVDVRVLAASAIEAAQIVTESNDKVGGHEIIVVEKLSHVTGMLENRYAVVPRLMPAPTP